MKIDGNTNVTLNVSLSAINMIVSGLNNQQERIGGVLNSIQEQVSSQISAMQPAPPAPPGDGENGSGSV